MEGCYEHGSEHLHSVKNEEMFDQLSDYQLFCSMELVQSSKTAFSIVEAAAPPAAMNLLAGGGANSLIITYLLHSPVLMMEAVRSSAPSVSVC
jgi:hypothetical protein